MPSLTRSGAVEKVPSLHESNRLRHQIYENGRGRFICPPIMCCVSIQYCLPFDSGKPCGGSWRLRWYQVQYFFNSPVAPAQTIHSGLLKKWYSPPLEGWQA